MAKPQPKLRAPLDRARQVALFEIGGLVLITPPFAWLSGQPVWPSLGLLALLAGVAATWNAGFNTAFDYLDGRWSGRTADRRPLRWRVFHALCFEGGMVAITLPIIAGWTGMSWHAALAADLGLAAAYLVYAFVFNLLYDRVFPIE